MSSSSVTEELLQALADELVAGIKSFWDDRERSQLKLGSRTFSCEAGEIYVRRGIDRKTSTTTELQIARVAWEKDFVRRGLWKRIQSQLLKDSGRWRSLQVENIHNDDFLKYLVRTGWRQVGEVVPSCFREVR